MLRSILSLVALLGFAVGGYYAWPYLLPAEAAVEAGRRDIAVPVRVSRVALERFDDVLQALGTVRSNESVVLTANSSELVAKVHFEDGQEVEAGQLLVELDATEETALLAEAKALRDDRQNRYDQIEELFKKEMSSAGELDNQRALLRAAEARVASMEARIADRQVTAPFAGTLGLRQVSEGALIDPNTVITTLDDLTQVNLDFTIPETWLPTVRPGMTIEATSDAYTDREFVGKVQTVDTRLDPETRAVTVRAVLDNEDRALRPGMLLKLQVVRSRAEALLVPEESLIPDERRQFVYVIDGERRVTEREVTLGRRRYGVAEVTEGLTPGELVIVEGMVRVRPGDEVEMVGVREGTGRGEPE